MSNVLTPAEWYSKQYCDGYPKSEVYLNNDTIQEYAQYYHSKMQEQGIKKDIILPEYLTWQTNHYDCDDATPWLVYNDAIDEVKRLNDIQ